MNFNKLSISFFLSFSKILTSTSSQGLTSSFKPVTSASGAALCAVGDWLAEFTAHPAAGGACVPLAAQCGWACGKTENCAYFNSWTNTGRCELFADGTFSVSTFAWCILYQEATVANTASISSSVAASQTSKGNSITDAATSQISRLATSQISKGNSVTDAATSQISRLAASQTPKGNSVTDAATSHVSSFAASQDSSLKTTTTSQAVSVVASQISQCGGAVTLAASPVNSEGSSQDGGVRTSATPWAPSASASQTAQKATSQESPSSNATSVDAQGLANCSFPFTYMGNLYYSCICNIVYNNLQSQLACLARNWTWVACPQWQENFTAQNITMNITIPTLNGSTPAMTVNGWIIFQQRISTALSFNQDWVTFRNGFGSLGSNYWMGNENIHLLTQAGTTYRLRIEMLFAAYGWMSAEYDQFSIDNETEMYRLHVAGYSNGECGDSLNYAVGSPPTHYHNGMPFTTSDRNNDPSPINCASEFAGGWWYNVCYWALLHSDTAANIGWWTASSPIVTQSRMMIKASD